MPFKESGFGLENREQQGLDPAKKFEEILKLFRKSEGRKHFLNLCQEYLRQRTISVIDSENYSSARKRYESNPQRARIHNEIMDILKRLSLAQTTPSQRSILNEMASREYTAELIKKYFEHLDYLHADDDEDEQIKKEQGMSEVARFHHMSKEH